MRLQKNNKTALKTNYDSFKTCINYLIETKITIVCKKLHCVSFGYKYKLYIFGNSNV